MSTGREAPPELLAITRAYELVRTLSARVDGFPRARRFVLGDRLLGTAYTVLELLIEARYRRERRGLLERANIELEKLRFQLRLAHDDRALSTGQYEACARQLDEVGRLVGGWRRSQDSR
jgi:hypothetical protein